FLLAHRQRRGLEIGAGIALAAEGRDDGIPVQIVEFLARFRVDALGAEFWFCHFVRLVEPVRDLPVRRRRDQIPPGLPRENEFGPISTTGVPVKAYSSAETRGSSPVTCRG